jgi:hypothetical protein
VKKPVIFYHAKITTMDPTHICGMCPRDMWIAAQRTGHLVTNMMSRLWCYGGQVTVKWSLIKYVASQAGVSIRWAKLEKRHIQNGEMTEWENEVRWESGVNTQKGI